MLMGEGQLLWIQAELKVTSAADDESAANLDEAAGSLIHCLRVYRRRRNSFILLSPVDAEVQGVGQKP